MKRDNPPDPLGSRKSAMLENASKTAWTARRKTKLYVCIDSFSAQFQEWKRRTGQPEWSNNYSQVRAIEALLVGVSNRIAGAALEAEGEADYAENLLQFEHAM